MKRPRTRSGVDGTLFIMSVRAEIKHKHTTHSSGQPSNIWLVAKHLAQERKQKKFVCQYSPLCRPIVSKSNYNLRKWQKYHIINTKIIILIKIF